jgi:hypothetical protein
MENVEVPYQDGHAFGIGVKSATGGRRGLGVVGSVSQIPGASGGSGGFQWTSIQTTSDMEDQLGISADASGGVGLFSASDRFNFAKNSKIQQTSIAVLLHCTRQFGFQQIDDPALSPSSAQLVSQGQLDLFADRFGDCFVVGLRTGGQFFGILRIDTKNEESRQTVENSLSGSYGPFSADVQVKVSDAMKSTQSQAYVNFYYEGGEVKMVKVTTPDDLFTAAQQWSDSVASQPKPYAALLLPYVVANGPQPPNKEDLQHQHDVLVRCAKLRSQTLDRQNLIYYMTDPAHRGEFVADPQGPDLAKLMAGISQDLEVISEAASFAIDNPKQALEPEPYAQQHGITKDGAPYTLTLLPANLPKHTGADNVIVPDFRNVRSTGEGEKLAADNRLTLHWNEDPALAGDWRVGSQDPPPGTPVAPNTTVTLNSTPSVHIDWRTLKGIQFARAGTMAVSPARFIRP